jgi:hypothetical protein
MSRATVILIYFWKHLITDVWANTIKMSLWREATPLMRPLFILQMYEHEHNKKMSTVAVAAMLSTMLYSRRFFPYYVYNIVAGLDEEGWLCILF